MGSPSSPDRVTRIAGEAKSVQRVVQSGTDRAPRRRVLSAAPVVALLAATLAAGDAVAIDFYEIQIYRTETDPQYHLQVELHSNSVLSATGQEAQEQLGPYQIHETIETTYGLLPHLEIGQYLCTAKLDNGHYEYAGSRTKVHFGIPQTMEWPVSLGAAISSWTTCGTRPRSSR